MTYNSGAEFDALSSDVRTDTKRWKFIV